MTVSIGLGLMEFPFAGAAGFWRWVDLCEHGGIDSLWQTDRIISRAPILESMTTMAALAGRTRRLKFGMNVVSLAFRDPVLLAKQCATIDMLSGGRLLPAFGIGSPLSPEWKALGIDTATRARRTDEALDIIRRLWTGESVSHEGRHHRLHGATILPLPAQPELPNQQRKPGASPARSAPPCARRAAASTTTITAPASHSASARLVMPPCNPLSPPTAPAPAAIPPSISPPATPPRSSPISAVTWMPVFPSSSSARSAPRTKFWRRRGA
jgi:alkanesulfonate monooxygenase SsuD/methylene tetrahydromethanopterin reductase-like flavin-dependent oxidoreductase (luciferase family)